MAGSVLIKSLTNAVTVSIHNR